ncbi:GmrSD restriction endonuclease domain-containing protein, partial [Pseudomonas viridiflava]
AALKAEVFKLVFGKSRSNAGESDLARFVEDHVAQLDYESHRESIRRLLLLFNIASLLELGDSGPWFPFDHFKKDQWDLEHIRSVKSDMPQRIDAQKAWLGQAVEYFSEPELAAVGRVPPTSEQELVERLRTLRDKEPFDASAFEVAFNDVIDRYDPGSDIEVDNSIGNLTLLDAGTNRSYGNAIFPHKRRKLIALDKAGRFVPPCTKNAFLKYYSTKIDEMLVWSRVDAKEHQHALSSSLVRFFTYNGACA